jgi:WhiB family transcriptional regulator, redox-sensing transcriptional regulator
MNLVRGRSRWGETSPTFHFIEEAWVADAACAGHPDPSLFFPPQGAQAQALAAKTICGECPVMYDCLSYALRHKELYGIWGGVSEHERRNIPKNKPLPQVVRRCRRCNFMRVILDKRAKLCDLCKPSKREGG